LSRRGGPHGEKCPLGVIKITRLNCNGNVGGIWGGLGGVGMGKRKENLSMSQETRKHALGGLVRSRPSGTDREERLVSSNLKEISLHTLLRRLNSQRQQVAIGVKIFAEQESSRTVPKKNRLKATGKKEMNRPSI